MSVSANPHNPYLQASRVFFILALLLCLGISPPLALLLGLVLALTVGHPYKEFNSKATKILLQASVVGLGFGMNLGKVLEAGRQGLLLTVVTIVGTLLLGFLLGKLLGIEAKISHLISAGTAICGGSAIAAVGPALNASDKEMSVSLGTIFILNSLALLIFPFLGHYFNLSQAQFGVWVAIAIHDTSSVVGAATKYGNEALQLATTIKLMRALWIVPVTIFTALIFKKKSSKISFPYFILFFLVASILRTYLKIVADLSPYLINIAKIGLTITLFLIGAGLSRDTLRLVGIRPLIQGVLLWLAISAISLWAAISIL